MSILNDLKEDVETLDMPKEKEVKEEKEEKKKDAPKVNIDVDSVIMNENVITDDEFFDDFFGEDE